MSCKGEMDSSTAPASKSSMACSSLPLHCASAADTSPGGKPMAASFATVSFAPALAGLAAARCASGLASLALRRGEGLMDEYK